MGSATIWEQKVVNRWPHKVVNHTLGDSKSNELSVAFFVCSVSFTSNLREPSQILSHVH